MRTPDVFRRFILISGCLAAWWDGATAQQYVDLLRFTSLQTPPNLFDSSDVRTPLSELNADVTLPLRINEDITVLTGGVFQRIETRLDESRPDLIHAMDVLVKVGCNFKLNQRSNLTTMLLPRYSGDGGAWGRKDYQLGAMALYKSQRNDRFLWQCGAVYNGELFGPIFVPLLGFYAQSESRKWEANFLLPVSADLNYTLSEHFRLGLAFASNVKSFYVNQAWENLSNLYWVKSTNEGYGYVHIEPSKGVIFQARVGHSVARKFALYSADDKLDWALMSIKFGDERTRLNSDFANGLIFQLRFIYRFYTPAKR